MRRAVVGQIHMKVLSAGQGSKDPVRVEAPTEFAPAKFWKEEFWPREEPPATGRHR